MMITEKRIKHVVQDTVDKILGRKPRKRVTRDGYNGYLGGDMYRGEDDLFYCNGKCSPNGLNSQWYGERNNKDWRPEDDGFEIVDRF